MVEEAGVIEVLYSPAAEAVQVVTYAPGQGWVQRGADLPVRFAEGDRFGAEARADGRVAVYQNGVLLGERDVSAWPQAGAGGYVGVWLYHAGESLLDDFAGGNGAALPAPRSRAGIQMALPMGKPWSIIGVFLSFSKQITITLGKMIKPPIVITETYDISIHPTVSHAEGFTELWDVRKGVYTVYDSEGFLLNMRVETIRDEHRVLFFRWITNHESVVISEPPCEIDRSEELRDKLIQYLTIGRQHQQEINKEYINNLSLKELIQEVGKDMPWVLK